jgi:OOP family OmpA-OmpF porin
MNVPEEGQMNIIKLPIILIAVLLLSSCASQMTQDEREYCIWRTSLAGTLIGAVGGVGGAAAGGGAGAALGTFMCGPVGAEPVKEKMMEAPLDSDGDGVPDSHDRCAGTPAGVKVDSHGCALDSDNDGVPDYMDQCPDTSAGVEVDSVGCPLSGESLLVLDNVNFDFKSAQLTAESEAVLDQAVRVLKQNTGVDVGVEGHTDSRGSESYNQQLSERRAASVRDYLISRGVDGSRLTSTGKGESSPVASNDTKEGRRQNRRVEFVVR